MGKLPCKYRYDEIWFWQLMDNKMIQRVLVKEHAHSFVYLIVSRSGALDKWEVEKTGLNQANHRRFSNVFVCRRVGWFAWALNHSRTTTISCENALVLSILQQIYVLVSPSIAADIYGATYISWVVLCTETLIRTDTAGHPRGLRGVVRFFSLFFALDERPWIQQNAEMCEFWPLLK